MNEKIDDNKACNQAFFKAMEKSFEDDPNLALKWARHFKDSTETLYQSLRDLEFAIAYLKDVIEDGDRKEILLAVKDIAKAQE